MGKIFCIFGKSSSGKDSVYRKLLETNRYQLREVVPYTTRPIRSGETEGKEYHFVTDETVKRLQGAGKVIELRAYDTVHGVWKYFTADDGQVNLADGNYLIIGTLEAYEKIRAYFGEENVIPIYIEVDDGIRLERALKREMSQEHPKYAELCRRFLADEQDFAEEKLANAGVEQRFRNETLEQLQGDIERYIGSFL